MSYIDLCNEALIAIGKDTIVSLDERSRAAELCKVLLPRAVEEIHNMYEWEHARVATQLSHETPENEDPSYKYAHRLPPDYSRVERVSMIEETPFDERTRLTAECRYEVDYRIADGLVYTNETPIRFAYYKKHPEAHTLPEYVRYAIVMRLAAKLCFPITKDRRLTREVKDEAQQAYSMAKDQEGQDEQHEIPENRSFRDQHTTLYTDDPRDRPGGRHVFRRGSFRGGSTY